MEEANTHFLGTARKEESQKQIHKSRHRSQTDPGATHEHHSTPGLGRAACGSQRACRLKVTILAPDLH